MIETLSQAVLASAILSAAFTACLALWVRRAAG